jgi:O-acetyl-ADP-ribose deacetylase (regulator of RNase III)
VAVKPPNCLPPAIAAARTAAANDCRSVAFPAISTGVYRYPKDQATQIAVGTASNFIGNTLPETLTFCCFDQQTAELYRKAIAAVGGA